MAAPLQENSHRVIAVLLLWEQSRGPTFLSQRLAKTRFNRFRQLLILNLAM